MKKSTLKDNPALQFLSTVTMDEEDEAQPKQENTAAVVPQTAELQRATKAHSLEAYKEVKSRRVQLLLPPSMVLKAKTKAEKQGISFNEYVCKVISKDLGE